MGSQLKTQIIQFLQQQKIEFEIIDHEQARTCEQSAQFRGTNLSIGGKTLMFKNQDGFHLFTLSANKEVSNKRVRWILGRQKLRFATEDELKEKADVVKGALPPIGRPILPFDLYLDLDFLKNEYIAFNAGELTCSIKMQTDDYIKIFKPRYAIFSK